MSLKKLTQMVLLFGLGAGLPVAAQSLSTWDTSGNKLVNGTFYFREVAWVADPTQGGALTEAVALYGNINFDGNGNYTISNSNYLDAGAGTVSPFSFSGTYSISANGYGFISSPISSGDYVYGLVAQGMFIGSSTEAGFNDLFIAAQLPSPTPTNSFFTGTYSIMNVGIGPATGDPSLTRDSLFQLNPDGNGNIGAVHASGYVAGVGSSAVTQNFSGVKYLFSNGAANVQLGGSLTTNNLIAGNQYLYFSPDGNFVFGGSPNDWNMIVGVKVKSGTPNFNGLYYQAGAAQIEQFANGYADLNTYYGSFKAYPSSGLLLDHQRILSVVTNSLYDYTDADSFTLNSDGTYDNAFTGQHYIFGNGGAIRIGIGNDPVYGISVALQAPTFSGSGVFLDPTGILNSGSSALFTAGIVRGELISMYGSGLAATTLTDSTFPTTLGGVQVKINGRLAPILSVSPNEVQVIVPYETELFSVAGIQVFNNNVPSNTVTLFTNATAPGIFTVPPGGVGYAAAQHASDFSLITPQSPAVIGETIVVYGTGLGDVTPAVADGAPGPVPVANTSNTITAFIGGVQATVGFAGLSPGLVGLYQVNITVPTGVTAGDNYLDVSGPDSYTSEAKISIGGTITASTDLAKRTRPVRPPSKIMHKRGKSPSMNVSDR